MAGKTRNTRPDPLEKGLPEAIEIERRLLGCVLTGTGAFSELHSLDTADFSLESHRRIFHRMRDLTARGTAIDLMTVINELTVRGELVGIGGMSFIADLTKDLTVPPTRQQLEDHIRILKAKTQQRRIIYTANSIEKRAYNQEDPSVIANDAKCSFEEIGHNSSAENVFAQIPSIWQYEDTTRFLVEDLLVEDAVTVWTGESGDGKSTVALALAGAVAQGHPFVGRAAQQRLVLYLDRENPPHVAKDRLSRLGIPEIPSSLKLWGTWWDGHYPPGPEAAELLAYTRTVKPFIIFDSLVAFAGCDENSASEMRQHMTLYRRLSALGATVLIIHHRSDKDEKDYRGSSDIRASVDAGWVISRADGSSAADPLGRLNLKPFKTRCGPGKLLRIEYEDGTFIPLDVPVRPPTDIAFELVSAYVGSTQKDLIGLGARHGLAQKVLVRALEDLQVKHRIRARRGARSTLRYYPLELAPEVIQ